MNTDTYKINNIEELRNSAEILGNNSSELQNNANSIKWIAEQVSVNWQNPDGLDIESIKAELSSCAIDLRDTIAPLIKKFADTLNTLVADTMVIEKRQSADDPLNTTSGN